MRSPVSWGESPPRIHGRASNARVIAVVTISLITSAMDPVARLTPRTWRAESTFAAISTRLSTTKRMRVHAGSITTSGEHQRQRHAECDRQDDQGDARARAQVLLEDVARAVPSPEAGLDVEEHPDEEQTDQRGRDLRHVEQEGVRHPSHGPEAYPPSVIVRSGRLATWPPKRSNARPALRTGARAVGKRAARGAMGLKTPPGPSEYRMWRDEEADRRPWCARSVRRSSATSSGASRTSTRC